MRTFFRLVRSNPPTLDDFRSDKELGEPEPANATEELIWMWDGVSFRSTENQARKLAQSVRRKGISLGEFIAVVEIPEDRVIIDYERTGSAQGHYTLWAEAQELLDRVVQVKRV